MSRRPDHKDALPAASRRHWSRLVALLFLGLATVAVYVAWNTGAAGDLQSLINRDTLAALVSKAGVWGPVLVIGLMTLAVVASPIPSAPIALAAGAAYGHIWGTFYVILGAEAGAMIAFGLARWLGRDVIVKWLGDKIDAGLLGSQNALTWMVFLSRLMPFVSFDMISYAAGLSRLALWRFALATLAGIIPASFVLAHLGGAVTTSNWTGMTTMVLGLGLITGLPVLLLALRSRRKSGPPDIK